MGLALAPSPRSALSLLTPPAAPRDAGRLSARPLSGAEEAAGCEPHPCAGALPLHPGRLHHREATGVWGGAPGGAVGWVRTAGGESGEVASALSRTRLCKKGVIPLLLFS